MKQDCDENQFLQRKKRSLYFSFFISDGVYLAQEKLQHILSEMSSTVASDGCAVCCHCEGWMSCSLLSFEPYNVDHTLGREMLVPIATRAFPDDCTKKKKAVYGKYLAASTCSLGSLYVGTSCMQQQCFAFLVGSSTSLAFVISHSFVETI